MKQISLMLVMLMTLSACAYQKKQPYNPTIIVNDPVVFETSAKQAPPIDMATQMSNESVIVFPVTGAIDQGRTKFPENRGVLNNTTEGGYTVFDPSVTVFAVGGQGARPAYLPPYSVPQYAEQYNAPSDMDTNGVAPMPRGPSMQSVLPELPTRAVVMPKSNVNRRSPPILTAYE